MLSMTGFGKSNTVLGTTSYTAEIRSVNNRFLDCSARLPGRFSYLEEQTLARGLKLADMTLAQMDAIWDEGKAKGL